MSAHIISELRQLGQGSRVGIEGIGKASTAPLNERYRLSARSVNLNWQFRSKRSLRPFANQLEPKTEVKSPLQAFLFLACAGFGGSTARRQGVFRFSARMLLEISGIDTQIITTLYKKVIIFLKRGRHFVILAYLLSDRWQYH